MVKKHERSHFLGKGPFQCSFCDEVFKFKSGCDYHEKLKHSIKNAPIATERKFIFLCTKCDKSFLCKKALDRHEENHKVKKNELQCSVRDCCKMFPSNKDLQWHMKLVHKNTMYRCSYCQKQYKSKGSFEIHIASHERNGEMKDYEFVTEPDVMKEIIIEEIFEGALEGNEDCDEEKEVNIEDIAEKIDENFVILETKADTEEQSQDPVDTLEESEDEQPVIRMEPPDGMEFVMETDEDYLIEQDEGMDFFETIIAEDLEPPPLSDDDLITQDDDVDFPAAKPKKNPSKLTRAKKDETLSICEECGSTFKNNSHLKRHVMRKHRKDEYSHVCAVCGQKFLLSYDLNRHMTKHSSVRNYECEKCSQKFKTELSLKNHIKVIHEPQSDLTRNFVCQHCNRSYFHRRHLDYHMRKHNGDQRYKCELCVPAKTFHYSDATKWHKIRHHGEAAPFNCTICGKKFIHEKSLATHEKEHQPESGSLSVNCPECGKKVSEKRHLKRHMRIHSMKEFHCECGESFKERHQLTK